MSAKQIAALQERAKLKSFPTIPTKVNHASSVDTKFNHLDLCICNRQLQDILCRSCGYIFVGRHRRQCSFHPNEILLMDSVVCPKCRTDSLIEIKTSKTPVKHEPDEIITELTHLRQRRCSKSDKGTRRNSVGTGTENEDLGNEFNNSFSPSNNINLDNGQKEISNQPVKHSNSLDMQHDDAKIQGSKNVRSKLTFDGLKSPESKIVGATNNSSSSNNMVGSNLMSRDAQSYVNNNMVHFSVQAKSPDYNEMPKLEQISGPVNSMMPLERQVSASDDDNNNRMPLSHQQTSEMPQCRNDKPRNNLVDTEVQTEFAPQFYYPTPQVPVRSLKEITVARGYNYEPRKEVGGEKENSILRAAIRRSNTEGWNKGLERMKDMCIGDRRF